MSSLQFEELPHDVVETAKLCVLDTVGVGLFSSTLPWARMAARLAAESGPGGPCTVWGATGGVTMPFAALANGVAAHGIEFDDRKPEFGLHPGCQVIPAAVAAAEHAHASGRQLLTGVTAGYEVIFRVGRASPKLKAGLNAAAHRGVWGAVAASCNVLGLDEAQTRNAFGIAGSMASGISQYGQERQHDMVKRLVGGWGAHCGALASLLAQTGFSAPWDVLEGRDGYLAVFGETGRSTGELSRNLGASYGIVEREVKPYSSWGGAHAVIDAIRTIRDEAGLSANRVRLMRISCGTTPAKRDIRRPQSIVSAQMSLPFLAAMAVVFDLRDPTVWTEAVLSDPDVAELVDKIELEVDETTGESAGNRSAGPRPVRVTVLTTDGKELTVAVESATGTLKNPMTPADIKAKFRIVTDSLLGDDQKKNVLKVVEGLDHLDDVSSLSRLLQSKSH